MKQGIAKKAAKWWVDHLRKTSTGGYPGKQNIDPDSLGKLESELEKAFKEQENDILVIDTINMTNMDLIKISTDNAGFLRKEVLVPYGAKMQIKGDEISVEWDQEIWDPERWKQDSQFEVL